MALFSLILFLLIGMVSANENNTINDNINDIIDNSEGETIKLDEKTYSLDSESETHVYLN